MTAWLDKQVIGAATVYLGDARMVLPALPKADLAVTDPPYKLTSGGRSKDPRSMKGKFAVAAYDNKGDISGAAISWPEVMELLHAGLVDDADCYVMGNDKNVIPAGVAAFAAGFRQHNLLVWHKRRFTVTRWYCKDCEFALYLFKGRAKTINEPNSKQLHSQEPPRGNLRHPTEKPVFMMRKFIRNSSQPGDMVIDPFMGTGSTGVAALMEGRAFTGIEIDRRWFDAACARLERVQRQTGGIAA